jgi:hypothetical protein
MLWIVDAVGALYVEQHAAVYLYGCTLVQAGLSISCLVPM